MNLLQKMTQIEKRMNEIHSALDKLDLNKKEERSQIDTLTSEYEALKEERAQIEKALKVVPIQITEQEVRGAQMGGMIPGASDPKQQRNDDPRGTPEYRKAFMEYCQKGIVSSVLEKRANETNLTSDVTYLIPSTVQNKVIQKLENYGYIYGQITKSNIKGGVSVPIATFNIIAHWVEETGVSETQKGAANTAVQFSYYLLEARVGTSLIASVTTVELFETLLVEKLIAALIKAIEQAVFTGTGLGQPTGILQETRIPSEQKVTVDSTKLTLTDWQKYRNKLPAAYRKNPANKWYMEQDTFDTYVFGLKDDQGQPVARVNYGIDGEPIYRFLGRPVEIVPASFLKSYADATGHATTGEPFCVYGDITQWALNSNMDISYVKYTDRNSNKVIDLAQMIADGKTLDAYSFVILKKGAA